MDRRKVRIYVALEEDIYMKLEELRKTPKGKVDRSELVNNLLREVLERKVVAND